MNWISEQSFRTNFEAFGESFAVISLRNPHSTRKCRVLFGLADTSCEVQCELQTDPIWMNCLSKYLMVQWCVHIQSMNERHESSYLQRVHTFIYTSPNTIRYKHYHSKMCVSMMVYMRLLILLLHCYRSASAVMCFCVVYVLDGSCMKVSRHSNDKLKQAFCLFIKTKNKQNGLAEVAQNNINKSSGSASVLKYKLLALYEMPGGKLLE